MSSLWPRKWLLTPTSRVWSGDPFSVYSRAEQVYVDGALMYDRNNPATWWRTDFELGNVPGAGRDR